MKLIYRPGKPISSGFALALVLLVLMVAGGLMSQQQISGGGSTTLGAGSNLIGKVGLDQTTPGTTNAVSLAQLGSTAVATGNGVAGAGVQRVAIASDQTAFAVNATLVGSAVLAGYVKLRPSGCTAAGTSDVVHDTVGVATGAGTSVSAVTGCLLECYVNNITNAAVTFRLADKSGTPVIWLGGNGDFSVPANSNLGCGGGPLLAGITFTSGMTAIAGTASALNLHIVTRE
jgi:hypothetical protein